MKPLALLTVSLLYWFLVGRIAGVTEPWDAPAYWRLWYPASFLFAAIGGYVFRRRHWSAGAIVTFAQLPVLSANTGMGIFSPLALALLTLLAVPCVAMSAFAGRVAMSRDRTA
ncbi:hypothetical protein NF699_13515 [Sphingomonadaceae bacterium OTU29LAMAA1]|uniref:hypothetical protein n=1 Tax=Sphingomonas sp. Leaf37 TaxID=2876552 RepID=UPI001E4EACB2|nr:hypothetical protein [Sphingomonas sp. Leaf37]USU04065.1 hypothetical protein NF699_13515 [Sphingomonadaceae bacterium OTU29LAMAA1]